MRARRTLAALLVATALAAAGTAAGMASTPAEAATPTVSVVVAPDGGGIVRSGDDVHVSVTVTNTGRDRVGGGRVALSAEKAPVADTSTLLDGIAHPQQVLLGFILDGATASVPTLDAGAHATLSIRIKKDVLAGVFDSSSGARLLYARYRAPGVQTVAESSLVRIAGSTKASVGLSTVIPVLAPASASGIVDGAAQEQLTGPDGSWAAALRAAEADPSATIALDPAVLASIRIAGDAAPPGAAAFLAQLGSLPNEFVRLPYADTDLTLARAAGSTRSLDPSSFAGVVLATTSQGPTPAPTATAGSTSAAATDLTTWNWSERKVAWPMPHTAASADLTADAAAGEQTLLSSDDVNDTAARRAAGPLARIPAGGSARADVLVSDATVSSLLAAASAGGAAGDAALATLTGLLATAAVSGETRGVLATVGRSGASAGLGRVLDLLGSQPWIRSDSLTDLGATGSAPEVGLKAGRIASAQVATARSLLGGERQVQQLGRAIIAGAETVTAPQRLTLLGTMSAAWRADDVGWRAAAATAQQSFTKVLSQVQLAKQSSPNLVGGDGTLAVYVVNDLPTPTKVVVHVGVSNGAVQFTDPSVTVTVPAGGRAKADMPFRSIRNGRTDLTLSLTTPSGTPIGREVTRGATVRAGFDTIVAVGLLIALGLLLALGVYRNVKRRRQPRPAAA